MLYLSFYLKYRFTFIVAKLSELTVLIKTKQITTTYVAESNQTYA